MTHGHAGIEGHVESEDYRAREAAEGNVIIKVPEVAAPLVLEKQWW